MKEIKKRTSVVEKMYISEDRRDFPYLCLAREQDKRILEERMNNMGIGKVSVGSLTIEDIMDNSFLKISNRRELETALAYLNLFIKETSEVEEFLEEDYPYYIGLVKINGKNKILTSNKLKKITAEFLDIFG